MLDLKEVEHFTFTDARLISSQTWIKNILAISMMLLVQHLRIMTKNTY